jgi:hypothetical protein
MDQTCLVVHKSRRPQARLKRQSHCFTYIVATILYYTLLQGYTASDIIFH